MIPTLTTAQLQALKADLAANANTVLIGGTPTAVSAVPHTPDAAFAVAAWYNLAASGPFVVWRDLAIEAVLNAITFASMTPADSVPTDTDLNLQTWIARALACQGKQFNLQNLTLGRTTAPMKRSNYRAALQDCLTNLPAGALGTLVAANWVAVRDAAKFSATNAEKLFATGTGTQATPADLVVEGPLTYQDVQNAWNS